eukprot:1394438-Amorphochlora_amoeboformis.AAC.1
MIPSGSAEALEHSVQVVVLRVLTVSSGDRRSPCSQGFDGLGRPGSQFWAKFQTRRCSCARLESWIVRQRRRSLDWQRTVWRPSYQGIPGLTPP